PLRIAVGKGDVLALHIAEIPQRWAENGIPLDEWRGGGRGRSGYVEHPYQRDLRQRLCGDGGGRRDQAQGEDHKEPPTAVPHGRLLERSSADHRLSIEAELCIRRLPTIQHRQSRAFTTRCYRVLPPEMLDDRLPSSTSCGHDEAACSRLVPLMVHLT